MRGRMLFLDRKKETRYHYDTLLGAACPLFRRRDGGRYEHPTMYDGYVFCSEMALQLCGEVGAYAGGIMPEYCVPGNRCSPSVDANMLTLTCCR